MIKDDFKKSAFCSIIYPYSKGSFIMKKRNLIILLALSIFLIASCSTSLGIQYQQPSNINMSNYRNVAVASASKYSGVQRLPMFLRFDITDPTIQLYTIFSTFDYDNVNDRAAREVSNMVSKVFTQSSYYSVMPSSKTDAYLDLYKIGKDPSAMLREDGVDAVIIPKITRFYNDEYVDAQYSTDSNGNKVAKYYIHRSIDIAISITVLDTATDRIVASKEYSAYEYDVEVFDPKFPYLFSVSQSDIVSLAISDMISSIVADFVPTSKTAYIDFMSNKPKNESAKPAYKAAEDGDFNYALNLFMNIWNTERHIPSGYNAAVIIACNGDIDRALALLNEIRSVSSDRDVNKLYAKLLDLKSRNEAAAEQFATKTDTVSSSTSSPYEFLLN